ncbi:hypothetical protein DKG71_00255 [Streptomyces sp. NEAU-S7GS2]|nr:hypothetical protein DKG71_00255 [Streptomyces sp. NEAU-S7GS2]
MHLPVTITVRPAQDAYDYEYFVERLADPSVLRRSVAVQIFRAPLLAVPVEWPRRGGYLSVDNVCIALAIRDALRPLVGFPRLRMSWSPYPDTCHVVEWGETPPGWWDDEARGRFYGYSEAAIATFMQRYRTRSRFVLDEQV